MVTTIRATALVLLLACSANAGIIQNEAPAPPPPSQQASAAQEPSDASDEPTANGIMQNEAPSSLMQIALDMLATLPALF